MNFQERITYLLYKYNQQTYQEQPMIRSRQTFLDDFDVMEELALQPQHHLCV